MIEYQVIEGVFVVHQLVFAEVEDKRVIRLILLRQKRKFKKIGILLCLERNNLPVLATVKEVPVLLLRHHELQSVRAGLRLDIKNLEILFFFKLLIESLYTSLWTKRFRKKNNSIKELLSNQYKSYRKETTPYYYINKQKSPTKTRNKCFFFQ